MKEFDLKNLISDAIEKIFFKLRLVLQDEKLNQMGDLREKLKFIEKYLQESASFFHKMIVFQSGVFLITSGILQLDEIRNRIDIGSLKIVWTLLLINIIVGILYLATLHKEPFDVQRANLFDGDGGKMDRKMKRYFKLLHYLNITFLIFIIAALIGLMITFYSL